MEILAAGSEGAQRHDALVESFAKCLAAGTDRSQVSPVPNADWVRAAGILALIGRLVMAGEAKHLPELEDELVAMVSSQG